MLLEDNPPQNQSAPPWPMFEFEPLIREYTLLSV